MRQRPVFRRALQYASRRWSSWVPGSLPSRASRSRCAPKYVPVEKSVICSQIFYCDARCRHIPSALLCTPKNSLGEVHELLTDLLHDMWRPWESHRSGTLWYRSLLCHDKIEEEFTATSSDRIRRRRVPEETHWCHFNARRSRHLQTWYRQDVDMHERREHEDRWNDQEDSRGKSFTRTCQSQTEIRSSRIDRNNLKQLKTHFHHQISRVCSTFKLQALPCFSSWTRTETRYSDAFVSWEEGWSGSGDVNTDSCMITSQ